MNEPTNVASTKHPHDAEPVYDPAGRCLICSAAVVYEEMRDWLAGRLSHTNEVWSAYGPERRGEAMVACAEMDAQEVVKRAAAIAAIPALIAYAAALSPERA